MSQMFLPVRRIEPMGDWSHGGPLHWPFAMPPVRQLLLEGLDLGQVTIVVGENGAGKSTIAEALAMAYGMNPEGGSTGAMVSSRPSESLLSQKLKLHRGAAASRKGFFLRAETMHNFYTYLEESRFETKLHERSHGESFLDLVEERIPHIRGLWILDEPESALSLAGCQRLVKLLQVMIAQGSQLVLSTHSPVLAAFPGAKILEVGPWGMRETEYQQMDLFRAWQEFFNDPEAFLHQDP